ncbi:hypothetical protein [Calothrix sp. CCY 0018]|uniref:hypothetical protein n=1 Tax=Calothrix sp. CCY 0018 TaxID=3103864 RepID=UPI0039C6C443
MDFWTSTVRGMCQGNCVTGVRLQILPLKPKSIRWAGRLTLNCQPTNFMKRRKSTSRNSLCSSIYYQVIPIGSQSKCII